LFRQIFGGPPCFEGIDFHNAAQCIEPARGNETGKPDFARERVLYRSDTPGESRVAKSGFSIAEKIFPFRITASRRAHGAFAGNGGFMKLYGLLAGLMLVAMLTGCGGSSKIDENKPIDQVAADAAKMGQAELQKMVDTYQAAIADKSKDVEAMMAKVKELPLNEMMGDKAKMLKDDVGKTKTSMDKLKGQMAVYAKELAAKK
jgi:hypothetical protein